MPRRNLWCLIVVAAAAIISSPTNAEPETAGLVAIWKGHIDFPPSDGFVGTGFHIGDGFVATAKHVLSNIGDEWFAVVASKSAKGNRVKVVSAPKCFAAADICFFRLDPSDVLIHNASLSRRFGMTCELPDPWPDVTISGFSNESEGLEKFESIQINARAGTFRAPDGSVYDDLIQTGAQTSPGTSGSPVVIEGTRNAIGVHIAFSEQTKDQVIFPFFVLQESIQIDGVRIFHPPDCAAGSLEQSGNVPTEASTSPAIELLREVLNACSVSRKIDIDADLRGSIETIFEGELTEGQLTYVDSAIFLESIPADQRLEAYKVYVNCLGDRMAEN